MSLLLRFHVHGHEPAVGAFERKPTATLLRPAARPVAKPRARLAVRPIGREPACVTRVVAQMPLDLWIAILSDFALG